MPYYKIIFGMKMHTRISHHLTCLFDILCKIKNWEPAYQICYCWFSSRQQVTT